MVSSVNSEDIKQNAQLEGQEFYSINSGVIPENMLALECNQENWTLLKLTSGWITDTYSKN